MRVLTRCWWCTQLRKTETTLTSAEKNLGSMAAQQAVLYRDHIKAFDDWVARTKALQNRVEEEQLAVADLKTKADRLDKLTSVLEMSDEGALRDEIRVLTRDVAKLESEQPVLARKYNLAIQEAELARKEADHVRGDFMDMQRTYQWRILYLELWKSGAEERLNRLVGIADSWVPQYDYKRVNDQLARVYKQCVAAALCGVVSCRAVPCRVVSCCGVVWCCNAGRGGDSRCESMCARRPGTTSCLLRRPRCAASSSRFGRRHAPRSSSRHRWRC